MQRLGGMDAAFLTLETPTHHMHVCGVLLLDPSTLTGDGTVLERVRGVLEERIHLMPLLRRRMLSVPLGIDHPIWIEDPDFHLDAHLRRATVHAPGTHRELAEVVGDIASDPLPRTRPLWEMVVVEGLADGTAALVSKMHHACIDGVTGADVMAHLLDLEPQAEPTPPPEAPWVPDEVPSELARARDALWSRLHDPFRITRTVVGTARSGLGMLRSAVSGSDGGSPALPFSGPRTRLSAPITPRRAVAFGQVQLDDLRTIKSVFGTTVNDVVLAASALCLRSWLAEHDDLPARPLVAAVPVSVRAEGDGTNQLSNLFVRLPVDTDDPAEVLERIHAETKDAKALHEALGAQTIQDLASIAPPGLANLAVRFYSESGMSGALPPVQNLVISNVPGPPVPLYLAGARVLGVYPFGPLVEGSGINLTVLSNMGNVDVGVIACPDTVPDLWDLTDGFARAVDDLLAAATARA